ncbi:MAG: hypothetical protein AAF609_20480 [Cyanobacteria bacterium P01_C01_bin.120]
MDFARVTPAEPPPQLRSRFFLVREGGHHTACSSPLQSQGGAAIALTKESGNPT